MIRFVFQLAIAIVVSMFIADLLGWAIYLGFAGFVFLVVLGVFFNRHGLLDNDESAPSAIWIISTMAMSATVAMLWVIVPLVWAWNDTFREMLFNVHERGDDTERDE